MATLNELHNEGQDGFVYTCIGCEKHVETLYHCTVCVDFDLCVNCFNKDGHDHKMGKLGFGLDDDSGTGDQKQTNSQESHLLSIQRCIKYLVHACQCRDAKCRLPSCHKMKRVVQHAKSCKQNTNGGCPICKQLIALCCYHANCCQEAKCPVPFCVNIKNKLRQQQLHQRLQQAQILKKRIATMQNRGMSGAVLQASPGNSNSSSQPSPGAQPHSSPHPPQPVMGMKPSSGPPVGALQAVQQVQATAARQTVLHIVTTNYGKGNLVVNPLVATSGLMVSNHQMLKPMSQMVSGVPNRMLNMGNVASWENTGYAQNPQPHQNAQMLNPQLGLRQPSQIMGGSNSMPNPIGNSAMGPPQVMPNPGPSIAGMQRPTQAWQQLLQALKSPASAQQQQQVLVILKANPQLMAAFIKEKAAQQQQQQQQILLNEEFLPNASTTDLKRPYTALGLPFKAVNDSTITNPVIQQNENVAAAPGVSKELLPMCPICHLTKEDDPDLQFSCFGCGHISCSGCVKLLKREKVRHCAICRCIINWKLLRQVHM